ncbi:hypothetical protein AB0D37_43650, partial [Streptomyces sp. NPDC048384]|uniref:hypothetical protein n=1 Tax=Streptomyces sp. NPDC048384 TaxID=3155487 RepID=UPI0034153AA0
MSFGIDPPTALIGSISRAMSPRANCARVTCAINPFRQGDELFVTLPGDVPDPIGRVPSCGVADHPVVVLVVLGSAGALSGRSAG